MASKLQSLLESAAGLLSQFSSASSSPFCLTCSQLDNELGRLDRRMRRIQALLSDDEERDIREGKAKIKLWLAELRDVADDSEDVLEKVEYELLQYQLVRKEQENSSVPSSPSTHEERGVNRQVCGFQSTPADNCPLPLHEDLSFQQQIITEIKEINGRLDEIYRDGLALKLHEGSGPAQGASALRPSLRAPTSCLVDEQGVQGRESDRRKVIDMLLLPDDDEHVGVVSIVGAGGLGKTTLAQLVYNDDKIEKLFERRIWVYVSESFDVFRLTKEILEAVLGEERSGEVQMLSNFSSLQERLHKTLQGQRFLLVLDDVWNEHQDHWDALWVGLSKGATGSRVLITTRSEKVSGASRVSEANMYRLKSLSYEDSWSLFEHRAFPGKSSGDYANLEPVGREIVKKCGGLPLAVKTLAGMLFYESEKDRWMDILRSELWEIPEVEDRILAVLKLSYYHLPSPIRPCFTYCGVFPKGYLFDREELVRMWIADGYIKPSPSRCMEDVGSWYFKDLLQRSLFQDIRTHDGERNCFVMHDLIHDLALSIGGGECSQVVDGRLSNNGARHLVLLNPEPDITRFLSQGSIYNLKKTRTLIINYISNNRKYSIFPNSFLSLEVLGDIFMRMKHLRVLVLGAVVVEGLPDSVGSLKHLRYLSIFSWSDIVLPETVGNLLNLQVLEARGRSSLELPERLKDLVNLRHIDFRFKSLSRMPRGIGRLSQLRKLRLFVMGKGSGAAGIEELTGLNHLQGELKIVVKSLDNWVKWSGGGGGHDKYREEVRILNNKPALESLGLIFSMKTWRGDQHRPEVQESLLESLQPHTNIKDIEIWRYGGNRFPEWMGHPSYNRLEKIHLARSMNCRHLPKFGQLPSLKSLGVTETTAGCEFLEAASFSSLETLILQGMRNCEGSSLLIGTAGGGTFPRLSYLKVSECHKLKCVRLRHLIALRELSICDCTELTELDFYNNGDVSTVPLSMPSSSPPLSGLLPQQVLINGHMHIPSIHTIALENCRKLDFPPSLQLQQLLPPSLREFRVRGSPLLTEWARSHPDRLEHSGSQVFTVLDEACAENLQIMTSDEASASAVARHRRKQSKSSRGWVRRVLCWNR